MSARRQVWLTLALMLTCFISHLNRISLTVAADEHLLKEYHLTPSQMGVIYSAFLVAYTLLMLPGGMFIDLFGVRAALSVVLFSSAIFTALTGALGGWAIDATWLLGTLFVVRSLMGALSSPLHPAAARAAGLAIDAKTQSFANGLITGAALLGIALTYKIFGALMDSYGWPMAFRITGVATLLVGCFWLVCARPLKTGTSEARRDQFSKNQLFACFRQPAILWLAASYAAVGYFQYIFFYWLHYYFDTILNVGKEQSRLYAGMPTFAMALAMPLGGFIADRIAGSKERARRNVAVSGLLFAAVFLVGGLLTKSTPVIVLCFTLSLAALGLSEGSYWASVVTLGNENAGLAASIMNTAGNGVGLLAPVLTPIISETFGWRGGLLAGAFVALLGAACWLKVPAAEVTNSQ